MVAVVNEVDIPHFAFPFRFGADGAAQVVNQDDAQEIEQGVVVLVLTELGERLEVPEFGVPDLAFTNDLDLTTISEAAAEWDERAEVVFREDRGRANELIRSVVAYVGES